MLVAEMAVNFHGQRAAVFVAEPSGDGRDVNAALNAAGGEQMAQIVMGQMSDTGFFFRRFHRQLGLRYAHHEKGGKVGPWNQVFISLTDGSGNSFEA